MKHIVYGSQEVWYGSLMNVEPPTKGKHGYCKIVYKDTEKRTFEDQVFIRVGYQFRPIFVVPHLQESLLKGIYTSSSTSHLLDQKSQESFC